MKREKEPTKKEKKKVRFAPTVTEIVPEDESIQDEELIDPPDATEGTEESEWLEDVKRVEEKFLSSVYTDEKDSIPIEPFNLDEERRTGRFEEDGFYIENRPDKDETDAWLESDQGTVTSIEVLRKHEEIQKRLSDADNASKPSLGETLDMKKQISEKLRPGENVLMALRRLAKEDMKEFESLTELADSLLQSGEIDVYSTRKEELETAPKSDEKDMFAQDSDEEKEEDFDSWPISELKRFLKERNVDCSTVVEKSDLVQKAKQIGKPSLRSSAYRAPAGFVYHSESGYFYSADKGLYYDGASRCTYDPRTQKWTDERGKRLN